MRAPLLVVVLAPLIHLVDQWCAEVRRWGGRPIACYESSSRWLPSAQESIDLLRAGARRTAVLVSTHATASLEPFKQLLARAPDGSVMLIGDEVHHLGANWARDALPETAGARIGLSATPERSEDEGDERGAVSFFAEATLKGLRRGGRKDQVARIVAQKRALLDRFAPRALTVVTDED